MTRKISGIAAVSSLFLVTASLALAGPAMAQSASNKAKIAHKNFVAADASKDGALSTSEFKKFIDMSASAGLGQAPTIKRMGAYSYAYSRVDKNGDGKVTWNELRTAAAK
ncbi:hypothetical protein [Alterisphingorhabdus coralli]|uniref:EF-hand domain-containing protein n=1 Tax=Alterisphingorhabdus coralli TaxID=3071408 RepID=A0AA97F675_9SPHN|nr:hypothetical protein [Parasphingorhabdus sp. SCSIO 66989]WOE74686.1 hypothetical protein RB602_12645 [Parasphingorhabdus sp. SCSIO 66989]